MASLAGTYNMICDQGATFSRSIIRKDSKKRVVPLTGYTARMQVRSTIDSLNVMTSLTTENNRIIINADNGEITLQIDASTTSSFLPGKYVYDLELVSPEGVVERLVMGSFTVRGEVTR